MDGEFDGLLVKEVFPRDAVERAVRDLEPFLATGTPVVFGTVLGRPLYQGGASSTSQAHLDDAERTRPIYRELLGFDPHERLAQVLEPALGGLQWSIPAEDGQLYNPGNIRCMEPGSGGLPAHAGNQFLSSQDEGPARYLMTATRAMDHMSYFVVLQRPEAGGGLSVFERLWEGPSETAGEVIPLEDNHEWDSVPSIRLTPGSGDLILFNAGRRWHRVEEIEGALPRITYGGFAAPSQDGTELHCWC
jgi:hapalindole-type alkaloid chlorinase